MKVQNIVLYLLCYFLLLVCSSLVAVIVWNGFADGVLYHCTDPGLVDVFPPFVHPNSDDVYLAPKWLVTAVWMSFVAAVFALPVLVLWSLRRFGRDSVTSRQCRTTQS